MPKTRFVTGIFSVYKSEHALDFKRSNAYPVGLELIFRNDAPGRDFAQKLKKAFAALPEKDGLLFREQKDNAESTIGFDCFFKNTDALRKVLSPALDGIGLYHEDEERVISRTELFDQARRVVSAQCQAASF